MFSKPILKCGSHSIWLCGTTGIGLLEQLPGKGESHTKGAGMLVVSLRGVNFRFWSDAIIFSRQGLV